MEHIGAMILLGNILIGLLYLLFKVFVTRNDIDEFFYPKSYRIYWKKKDILYCVFKLITGLIIFVGWFYIITFVDISITTKNQGLSNYLNISTWALICFGGYLTYYIYKYIFKMLIGSIIYFVQKRRKNVSTLLLKSINENDSQEVLKNIKLIIQSGNYIDLGSQEYMNLLNILIANKEYVIANQLVNTRYKYSGNKGNIQAAALKNNSMW
ncbi:hypothetical protein NGH46_12635 [Staphylococcus xylosus]|uniref:hypothetical protein n=1 Tax=Staphylococcus xylosus TaxID=1288 RepID=UPI002DB7E4D7|nr:hypothetical protein [Staphylococcus xylosus]MEB8122972.1 hypothetical protein [Staphylococcus xylosus]